MPALNFPDSPTNGQQYVENGISFVFNGTKWIKSDNGSSILNAGIPGQALIATGEGPNWNFNVGPTGGGLSIDEGLAFVGFDTCYNTSGYCFSFEEGWLNLQPTYRVALPSLFWVSVSYGNDHIFWISYDDNQLTVVRYNISTGVLTTLPVPSGLPAITGTNYVGTVSDDGMHFYFGINGVLYHVTADSPGVLSTSSTVEGTTLTLPGTAAHEQILIHPDSSWMYILDGNNVVHKYTFGTAYQLSTISTDGTITLDAANSFYGMSYYYMDGYLCFHTGGSGMDLDYVGLEGGPLTTTNYASRIRITEPILRNLKTSDLGTVVGDVTKTGTQTISGAKTFTETTQVKVIKFAGEFDSGASGTSKTIDFVNGQKQKLQLTGNVTVTFAFPGVGNYQLLLVQDATGNRTVTWSGVSKYVGSATAPEINLTASSETIVSIYYDGTAVRLAASKVNA